MKNILWFDKITPEMERVAYSLCPEGLTLRFLEPQDKDSLPGKVEDADYFLVYAQRITKETIDQAKGLKMIQRTGAGYDRIDIDYAREKGIPVAIAPGMNAPSVSELAVLHMLTVYRKIHLINAAAKEGIHDSWKYRHDSYEIYGKTIGVIGSGAIGRAVIKKLSGFEPARILYYDAVRQSPEAEESMGITYCTLDELAAQSDIVTVHVPLFDSTRKMIGKDFISKMKTGAILINTARGPVVDQEALVEAVKTGKLAGAGLDVFDPEPYTKGSEVLAYDNIITTPHIGSATLDNFKRSIAYAMNNMLAHAKGEKPEGVINNI